MYAARPRGMSKEGQKEFVQSMVNWITMHITKTIDEGRIPANWEAEELRLYITEKFTQGCNAMRYADAALLREYEHDVITRSL